MLRLVRTANRIIEDNDPANWQARLDAALANSEPTKTGLYALARLDRSVERLYPIGDDIEDTVLEILLPGESRDVKMANKQGKNVYQVISDKYLRVLSLLQNAPRVWFDAETRTVQLDSPNATETAA